MGHLRGQSSGALVVAVWGEALLSQGRSLPERALLLAPGIALVLLGLHNGGFFPMATAVTAVATLAVLLLWATLRGEPLAGFSRGAGIAAGALAAFAAWTLASSQWSDAPSRALIEYDRVLLYLGVFVVFALLGRSGARARLLVGGLAIATSLICIGALGVWLLPHTFPTDVVTFERYRLTWPTSYWNATGLLAGLATVFALHFSASLDMPRWLRAVAAALLPLCVATLWFTVSRGAAGATVIAVGVYLVVGASRGLFTAGPVAAIGTVAALVVAKGVEGIATADPSGRALDDGRRAALLLALIALACGSMRFVLGGAADRAATAMRLPTIRVRSGALAAGAAVLVLAVGFVALGGPGTVSHGYRQFVSGDYVGGDVAPAERFTTLSGNDRANQWKIALHGLRDHPLHGTGAGTYALAWQRGRDTTFDVTDAHSLYAEQAGELGIVGVLLLLVALGSIVAGLVLRVVRGPDRAVWAALLAAAAAWLVHAGVDWDWEMPALTLWLFAAGGLALSTPAAAAADNERPTRTTPPVARIAAGLACILLALTPVAIWRSQKDLVDALEAFRTGDCAATTHAALASNRALSSRPEPFELLSYCDARAGQNELALQAANAAVRRDPHNWEFHYAQAIIRGVIGRDPRAAAQAALRLNPRSEKAQDLVRRFTPANRDRWQQLARHAPLNAPGAGRAQRGQPQAQSP